jgi:hypothetical protein
MRRFVATSSARSVCEGMLTYRLGENGRLVAPSGQEVAFPWHLLGDDRAEFMAVFTHGELESLDPIVEEVSAGYRLLGRGVLWARRTW